jgi:cytochrome b involved in lipid metabolism
MHRVFIIATVFFWLLVGVIRLASEFAPVGTAPVVTLANRLIVPADLARHASPEDCWMAIRGEVYDLSAYLPEHPTRLEIILPWCGKEATEAYDTKNKGRPHSAAADQLLDQYRIGALPGSSETGH